ncbi:MAG: carbohydrate-binding domain-containing protein [Gammaproteobacteria bacterium]|nr:carbohydrate-binding domain-containing protein [Gammaproteobacteria bacterium]
MPTMESVNHGLKSCRSTHSRTFFIALFLLVLFTMGACSSDSDSTNTSGSSENTDNNGDQPSTTETIEPDSHEDESDYTWDSADEVLISLDTTSISVNGAGATVSDTRVTIESAGTYRLSGTLGDGQITVDTDDKEVVRLIFDGINIANSTSAAVNIASAEKTVILLEQGSDNFISDALSYVYDDPEEDEPNAALFSDDDLTIFGTGSLTVNARYNDGIASKDGLLIKGGTINVTAEDDGIRGKDYLIIENGNFTINSNGDGLKSDEDEDAELGYISIAGGSFDITANQGDAIQAETNLQIEDGEFTILAGDGHTLYTETDPDSKKGLKAGANLFIEGGSFSIDAADDAVHSNNGITIDGGTFELATGDDAMHADGALEVNDGSIDIDTCYEGLEAVTMTLNGGTITVSSNDDAINAAGDAGENRLYIHGGDITVYAEGDGIDVNGAMEMTGGTVLVHGPITSFNAALDYDATFSISGGLLIAAGSSRMAQTPGSSSSQNSLEVTFGTDQAAGQLFHIQGSGGEIVTFAPAKAYRSLVFSSPELHSGSSYSIYTGGSSTGTEAGGLYEGGSYSPGSLYADFTVNNTITVVD